MPSLTDQIGRVLADRYRLVALIGTGASAHVYAAEDVSLSRTVAVKILHPGLANDRGFLRRFQAEARSAASLNHPHVLRVLDWGEDLDGPFLVLEHLGGGSLRDVLDNGSLLSQAQAASVGADAASGLAYAHRQSLVHRDIKPANILFDEEGSPRVADFGLARALAEAAWTEPTGALLGTARYASPEQAEGRLVDDRADVYSLALVLFECLTGWVPFAADTTVATLMARLGADLPLVPQLGVLGPILRHAAAPDPNDRLDASELAAALQLAARDLPAAVRIPLVDPANRGPAIDRDPTLTDGPATVGGHSNGTLEPTELVAAVPVDDRIGPSPSGSASAGPGAAGGAGATAAVAAGIATRRSARAAGARAGATVAGAARAAGALGTAGPPSGTPRHAAGARRRGDHPEAAAIAAPRHWWRPSRERSAGGRRQDRQARGLRPVREAASSPATGRAREGSSSTARRRGTGARAAIIAGVAIASAVVIVVGYFAYRDFVVLGHVVPKVKGLNLSRARETSTAADVRVITVGRRYDSAVPAGDIISQSVEPGTHVSGGTAVYVVISRGPQPVEVPSLDGDDVATAESALHARHLVPQLDASQYNETVPLGTVISWSPTGVLLLPGSTVSFDVSLGPEPRIVPSLARDTWAEAQAALEELRLNPVESLQYSNSVSYGYVIGSSPGPSTSVPRGSNVTVEISKGPEYVQVPQDLDGMTIGQATQVLESEGLEVAGSYGPGRVVISSYPRAGATVRVGTAVTLYTI